MLQNFGRLRLDFTFTVIHARDVNRKSRLFTRPVLFIKVFAGSTQVGQTAGASDGVNPIWNSELPTLTVFQLVRIRATYCLLLLTAHYYFSSWFLRLGLDMVAVA